MDELSRPDSAWLAPSVPPLPVEPSDLAAGAVGEYGPPQAGAAAWSLGGRLIAQAVQIGGFIVLARLLGPHDFGIVAIATIFVSFSQIFTDLGVGPAVVARTELTEEYLSTAFWLNAVSGLVVALAVAPIGLLLAAWFDLSALRWVMPVLSLGFVFSVSAVSVALLEREFRFRAIAAIDIAGVLVAQAVTVILAETGYGIAGLALTSVVAAVVTSALALLLAGWRPRARATRSDFRALRMYAVPLIGFNAVNYWARNIDNLLIGRVFGANPLAFYSRSYQLMLVPIQQVNYALDRFLQVAFARDVRDRELLERRHRRAETMVAYFGFTACALIAPSASDIVREVFGGPWHPMARLLAIFALSIGPQVVTGVNGALMRATGDTRLLFRLGLINAGLFVVGMAIATIWSVEAVAWAFVAVAYLTMPLTVVPTCRHLGFRIRATLLAVVKAVPLPAVLYGVLEALHAAGRHQSPGLRLGLQAGVALLVVPMIVGVARRSYREIDD